MASHHGQQMVPLHAAVAAAAAAAGGAAGAAAGAVAEAVAAAHGAPAARPGVGEEEGRQVLLSIRATTLAKMEGVRQAMEEAGDRGDVQAVAQATGVLQDQLLLLQRIKQLLER
jgi:hypothetical protein